MVTLMTRTPTLEAIGYRWKTNSRIPVKADIASVELNKIAEREGAVTPSSVVDAARPDDAPLHPAFTWDDSVAAEKYREQQAAHLIRSIVVVYRRVDTREELPCTREFIRVLPRPDDDPDEMSETLVEAVKTGHYIAVKPAMSEEELRRRYEQQALDDLWRWRQRYHDIAGFAALFAAIERTRQEFLDDGIAAD